MSGRILHLAIDEKFVGMAVRDFERAAPGANFFVVMRSTAGSYLKSATARMVSLAEAFRFNPRSHTYSAVVVHSLTPVWWPTILRVPRKVPIIWIGWGYDYYDLLRDQSLILPHTKKLVGSLGRLSAIVYIKRWLMTCIKKIVIKRISYFAPVLEEEFSLIAASRGWKGCPAFIDWNYGNLEEDLIKGYVGKQVSGGNILLGNSASATCNHIDSIEQLRSSSVHRKVIVPLSYGDKRYGDAVARYGKDRLGNRFIAIRTFLPTQNYVDLISSCGFFIMNSIRQQGVGNILTMLYLGARVFLREENPTYKHFLTRGVVVNSMSDLAQDPHLLTTELNELQREKNRQAIERYWSQSEALERTLRLLSIVGKAAK